MAETRKPKSGGHEAKDADREARGRAENVGKLVDEKTKEAGGAVKETAGKLQEKAGETARKLGARLSRKGASHETEGSSREAEGERERREGRTAGDEAKDALGIPRNKQEGAERKSKAVREKL